MRSESLPLLQRLLKHVSFDPASGCWVWTGYCDPQGYARHREGRRLARVHRTIFEVLRPGVLTVDDVLDHVCRNRGCVNPNHLDPVTSRENTLRGVAARRSAGSLALPFPPKA
jgi:hypothetical protein